MLTSCAEEQADEIDWKYSIDMFLIVRYSVHEILNFFGLPNEFL